MDAVLVDTGIWYSMFDPSDHNYQQGRQKAATLESLIIVVPWPTMYETLRTRFVRKKEALRQFEVYLKRPNVEYEPDGAFQDSAFALALKSSLEKNRPLSMVDCLIRLMLEDVNLKINYLATFNEKDFSDVCRKRRVCIV